MTTWRHVSAVPRLRPSEIHVWRIHLDQAETHARRLENFLSAGECDQAADFQSPDHRRRFVIRRGVLRNLLGSYQGVNAATVQFIRKQHGKPAVSDPGGAPGIRFSCSHSGDWGLIAIDHSHELGVDIERNHPLVDLADLAVASLSPSENNELILQPAALKIQFFFDLWTRKEAFLKAIGTGLSFPLKEVPAASELDQVDAEWKSVSLEVKPNYSAALVFENRDVSLRYLDWNPSLIQ